jgi:DNA-directed RNA polymerase subunit RPC12/RpoP
MQDGVVAATFATVGEAEAALSALDAAGIEAFVADENMVAVDWMYSQAIGGVKVLVREEDLEEAQALLAATAEPDEANAVTAPEVRCPRCGSEEFYGVEWRRLRAITLLGCFVALFVVPLWLVLPKWKCERCGRYAWRAKPG